MVVSDSADIPEGAEHYVCAYAARKDGCSYTHTREEIMEGLEDAMKAVHMEIPEYLRI